MKFDKSSLYFDDADYKRLILVNFINWGTTTHRFT